MKIKTSAPSLTPKNLSMSHYTTIGFGQVLPVCNYEVCPKTNMTIKPSVFARTDPQKLPNLGSIQLNMNAFFVPFHLVWKHFENFVVGRSSWTSSGLQLYRNVPFTTNKYLSDLFIYHSDLAVVSQIGDSDFGFPDTNLYFKFTKKGKCSYHILSSLGYKFNFVDSENQDYDEHISDKYSLLPLMCFFKAFMDRYIPSYLQISCPISQFFEYVAEIGSTALKQPLEDSRIYYMFDYVYTYYESNYFTMAWTSPNSPLDGVVANFGTVQANTPDLQKSDTSSPSGLAATQSPSVNSNRFSNELTLQNNSLYSVLTDTQLSLLNKFGNLVRKLNYSGSRTNEALRSLFGINPDSLQIQFSEFLGSCSTELQKTDVTNTSDDLGAMAGKSWFADGGDSTFKVSCDYYGMVFVFASLNTPSNFVRGIRRNLTHLQPLSFYNPELDGTLLQATRGSELFSQLFYYNLNIQNDLEEYGLQYLDSYGFVPRYCEYNLALDNVSGDFDIPSLRSSISPFILPRELFDAEEVRESIINGNSDADLAGSWYGLGVRGEKITPLDVINSNDSVQYNRIFKDTTGLADPFFCVFHFDTLANSPTLPLDEVSELRGRGKELEFSQGGHYVN